MGFMLKWIQYRNLAVFTNLVSVSKVKSRTTDGAGTGSGFKNERNVNIKVCPRNRKFCLMDGSSLLGSSQGVILLVIKKWNSPEQRQIVSSGQFCNFISFKALTYCHNYLSKHNFSCSSLRIPILGKWGHREENGRQQENALKGVCHPQTKIYIPPWNKTNILQRPTASGGLE